MGGCFGFIDCSGVDLIVLAVAPEGTHKGTCGMIGRVLGGGGSVSRGRGGCIGTCADAYGVGGV